MNDSLETLLADGIIDAVIGQLKTGKEAEVWLVQHAGQVVAAKLYKERHERNFRNNSGYKEGREVRNSRTRRAMEKGSRFGQAAAEEAWKNAEADSLYKLHAQGVRVPTPVLFYEGILLMELVRDAEGQPAPRLVEAPPQTPEEAEALYLDLRAQVVRTLCADLIHGDLSPYNILMSGSGATIIDFPQTVAAARNSQAEFYFRRDLDNVRQFLEGFSTRLAGRAGDTGEIWNAYVRRELTPEYVPSGAFREAPRRQGAGRQASRQERFLQQEEARRNEARPAPVVEVEEGLSAEEAELRALEALVLRQGGGERGRPIVTASPRDGRRRGGFGGKPPPRTGNAPRPGSGGPQQNAGARPPQGGGNNRPNGNTNGRPQQGGPRNGAPTQGANAPVAQGDARMNGRPQQGGPRNGPPRSDGRPPRQPNGGARMNGQPMGENAQAPQQNGRQPRMNGQPYGENAQAPQQNGRQPRMNGQPHGETAQAPQQNGRQPRTNGQPMGETAQASPQNGRPPRTNGQPMGETAQASPQNSRPPRMNGQSRGGEAGTNGQAYGENGQAPQQNGRPPRMNGQSRGGEAGMNGQPRMNGQPAGENGQESQQNGRPPRMNGRSRGGESGMKGPSRQNDQPHGGEAGLNGSPRMNGQPHGGEPDVNGPSQSQNGNGRPPRNEWRSNGRPQQNGGPRQDGPGAQPRMNGRPPRNNGSFQDDAPQQNSEPRQNGRGPGSGPREARGTLPNNGPRMPRQGPERGAGRSSRGSAPQVSYVARPPAASSSNPETGSS
ncbi:RIO1 family protein [Corallococcus coralloides]|uniref:non-specific serine/threonine protein kinase n=1 Tax=Corallococcus coralloides TaxID=184914 RepID=A0A410RYS8_CORCK|nr:RIO1 family regulatory kinase/ATPase [Corallococcus coralloides]QAT87012.1 RIO1 family protein [Corallococcus coralloides]